MGYLWQDWVMSIRIELDLDVFSGSESIRSHRSGYWSWIWLAFKKFKPIKTTKSFICKILQYIRLDKCIRLIFKKEVFQQVVYFLFLLSVFVQIKSWVRIWTKWHGSASLVCGHYFTLALVLINTVWFFLSTFRVFWAFIKVHCITARHAMFKFL